MRSISCSRAGGDVHFDVEADVLRLRRTAGAEQAMGAAGGRGGGENDFRVRRRFTFGLLAVPVYGRRGGLAG